MTEEVNCKKELIDSAELSLRLSKLSKVFVTKGKKVLELDPETDKEEILSTAIGRSGNLRAPSVRHRGILVVGFHETTYASLF